VSRASIESRHCVQEISFAVDEGRPILVVYLEPVELPVSLRMALKHRQAIFKFKEPDESFRKKVGAWPAAIGGKRLITISSTAGSARRV
jgi:hypothetical protein